MKILFSFDHFIWLFARYNLAFEYHQLSVYFSYDRNNKVTISTKLERQGHNFESNFIQLTYPDEVVTILMAIFKEFFLMKKRKYSL